MSNTVTAFFKGRVGVSEAVYQNDYGIVMNFDSIELPAHFDCYFSVMGEDEAIPGIGADRQVVIPNSCLSNSGTVTLHIPIHSGTNDSEVEYIVYFKVIGRARPVDDGTPAQMTAIEQALALLQNPIGNIEQIVNEALAFTGDTFAEMQAALDADQSAFETQMGTRADTFEAGIRSDIADVESDFDNLNAQYQTAVSALTVDSEVQNIRVGADNVTYASAGESVRTQFTNLKADIDLLVDGRYEYEISWEDGDINNSGQEIDSTSYIRSDFIPSDLLVGKSYHLNGISRLYIFYFDANKAFISLTSTTSDGTFVAGATASYMRFTMAKAYEGLLTIDDMETDTAWLQDINALKAKVPSMESDINSLEESISGTVNYEVGKYITQTGVILDDADYCLSEKIDISNISGALFWYGTNNPYRIMSVSLDENDNVIDYWGGLANYEYRNVSNFGTGAKYFRFSFPKGYEAKLTSAVYSDGTYTTYWSAGQSGGIATHKDVLPLTSSVIGKEGLSEYASSLASGSALLINSNISIKKNKVYHLHTLIDSNFDTVYFGHGESTYSLYFKIDNTNITFMTNGSEGSQLPHGLTLNTYLDFMLIVGERNTGTIILNTLGGVYTHTVQTVNGYKGNVFVRPSGCTLTEVFIGFSCADFRQPIWMFGDSYFTHTSDARWTYWLLEWGFGRCLMNAFAGENSSEALPQALSYLSNNGTPKYIVWCMGMNDPDSGAVNASWLACVETLISNCEKYGVEPILATIPNVPSYDNTYKNAWVKASGYRYIDFAKAVGAESAGSTWYAGCLSNDNTHPTELGARLLCLQALQDVSELTLGNV